MYRGNIGRVFRLAIVDDSEEVAEAVEMFCTIFVYEIKHE